MYVLKHMCGVAFRERCQAMLGPRIGGWCVVLCVGCHGRQEGDWVLYEAAFESVPV